MCGRTCLTLEPNEIQCACKFKSKIKTEKAKKKENLNKNTVNDEKDSVFKKEDTKTETAEIEPVDCVLEYLTPDWRDEYNCGRKYIPSYNLAPGDLMPVLVSADHFDNGKQCMKNETLTSKCMQSRLIVPMLWGMIPFWHKGDYRKHGLTTNNCRREHMLESKLYSGPFRRGQRCVVLCEGMYEWQTTKSAKPSDRAAYLVYNPQKDGIKIYDKSTWNATDLNMLKMAGLFDVWEDENGDKIYSFTVITYESTKLVSWLHHRMPAILETEQQVETWLDYKHVSDKEALDAIAPPTKLQWHRVANIVNNSRNKSDQCNKPIEMVLQASSKAQIVVTPQNKTLLSWLNVRKRREETIAKDSANESDLENSPKRPRYRDFKKSITSQNNNTSISTYNNDEKPSGLNKSEEFEGNAKKSC